MKKVLTFFVTIISLAANAYDFTSGNYAFNIVSATELTVEIANSNNEFTYSGELTFPETVDFSGKTFRVVGIGESAFAENREITAIVTPNSFEYIGTLAFRECENIVTAKISNVKRIGRSSFSSCSSLKTIEISEELTELGTEAFFNTAIESITLPNSLKFLGDNTFGMCKNLKSIKLPSDVPTIPYYFFQGCESLTSIEIPQSVNSIGRWAFLGCIGLTEIEIPESVSVINGCAFNGCEQLSKVIFNRSNIRFDKVEYWNGELECAFENCNNIKSVVVKDENPTPSSQAFSQMTYLFATLYVPKGTVDAYKAVEGWNYFTSIEEIDEDIDKPAKKEKCALPKISYANNKLTFTCETESAEYVATISDSDIKTHYGNEISLTATYTINLYAKAAGYENSDVTTATLCWLDAEPKTEGMIDNIATARGNAILIQSNNGTMNISGVPDGVNIAVYSPSGMMVGFAKAYSPSTSIDTGLRDGEIAIVKIGDKSIKVVMK